MRNNWYPIIERYIEPIPWDGCWIWMGYTTSLGYGRFTDRPKHEVYAHRWVAEQVYGPLPEGQVVMHTCDHPSCVNPAHLRVATQKENIQDAFKKGRMTNRNHVRGVASPSAKLCPEYAATARTLYSTQQFTQAELASLYKVHKSTMQELLTGGTWK